MKIFITGATGYIGEHLAIALLLQNYEVVALVRSSSKASGLAAAGATLVVGDLESTNTIEQAMQGADVVFHLAAYAKGWPEEEHLFNRINVAGTATILAAAFKNKVKKVVFTSTAGVYGPSYSAAALISETTRRSGLPDSFYERSKVQAEALAREYAAKGLPVVMVNPARVYGPGRQTESNAIGKLIALYLEGKWHLIPGDGTAVGSYCYIHDVVKGHLLAMEKGKSGENYLLGGENATYNRLFDLIRNISGRHYFLFRLPAPLLVMAGWCLETGARLTKTKPLVTVKLTRKFISHGGVSSRKAVQQLGYTITPLEEGLKKTIEWMQKT